MSICSERFFFFLFKGVSELYNVPKYEYTSLPGKEKNDRSNLTLEVSPRAIDGFPLPVGIDRSRGDPQETCNYKNA